MHDSALHIPSQLNGRHRHTYEAIFHKPAVHNLEWHDVRSLLEAIAEVSEGHNGALQISRNGQSMTFHPPKHKDVSPVEHLPELRRFLEQTSEAKAEPHAASTHVLVVIDHHEAKIYRADLAGSIPESLVPYDPHGYGKHLRTRGEETDGKRKPERKSYYEAVADTLKSADQIVLFGSGTGASSAMEELLAELRKHHGAVAERVIGTAVVDAHHETEDQLLARGREFFAAMDEPKTAAKS